MVILQHNGKQFTITIPEDVIKQMGWKKGTDLYVGKDIGKDVVYIIEND